jgi:hypothetical protein
MYHEKIRVLSTAENTEFTIEWRKKFLLPVNFVMKALATSL